MKIATCTRTVSIITMLAILFGTVGCGLWQRLDIKMQKAEAWQPPRVVTIEGVAGAYNYTRYGMSGLYRSTSKVADRPLALPVRHGDILTFPGEECCAYLFQYRDSDGPFLSIAVDSSRVRLHGKTVTLAPSEEQGGWEWLDKAAASDLDQLRLLVFNELDSSQQAILKRLASRCPTIMIGLYEEDLLSLVAPISSDFWMVDGPIETFEDFSALRGYLDVEYMQMPEDLSLPFLTRFRGLRTLEIGELTDQAGPFPAGMEQLQTLIIYDANDYSIDSSNLGSLTGLQELHLQEGGALAQLYTLARLPKLRTITCIGELDSLEIAALQQLEGIKWLGLPANTSQDQFAAIVSQHPDLLGLELIDTEDVHDLSPLTQLHTLEYLIILSDLEADLEPLFSLTSLRYLLLPEDVFEDSLVVVELERALPQAVIVPGVTPCLGSGWILVLLPGVALAWRLRRRGA